MTFKELVQEQTDDIMRVIVKHSVDEKWDRRYIQACFSIVCNIVSHRGWLRGFNEGQKNRNAMDSRTGRQRNSKTRLRGTGGARVHTGTKAKTTRRIKGVTFVKNTRRGVVITKAR